MEIEEYEMKKSLATLFLAIILVIACTLQAAYAQKARCSPPSWIPVPNPDTMTGLYYGVGEAKIGKDRTEAKQTAYDLAVSNLALMAGQKISSSFKAYQAEKGKGKKIVAESRVTYEVKLIAQHDLKGITIREAWEDTCRKTYYVLVTINQDSANRQIDENAKRETAEEIRAAIHEGIKSLEARVVKVEKDVGGIQKWAAGQKAKYGDLLVRLASLEKANEEQQKSGELEGHKLVDLKKQIAKISNSIAQGAPRAEVEKRLEAAEWVEKGNNSVKNMEFVNAIRHYDKAIELDPSYGEPYFVRAIVYLFRGNVGQAIQDATKAIEMSPWDASRFYVLRGVLYYQDSQYEQAFQDFNRAIALRPDYANAYIERGNYYRANDQYDEALWDYNKAIELDPWNDEAYFERSRVLSLTGQYDRAEKDLTKTQELRRQETDRQVMQNPEDPAAYASRAKSEWWDGKYDEALRDYSKAIELDPEDPDNYVGRGNVHSGSGEYDLALRDYNKAIALDSNSSSAYWGRGNMYESMRRFDLARKDKRKSEELAKHNSELEIERMLLEDPENATVYLARGHERFEEHKYDRAIEDFSKVIAIYGRHADAYRYRGDSYREKGEFDLALRDYNKAIAIDERNGGAYYGRGVIYEKKGRKQLALNDYEKARDLGNMDAFYLLRRLNR